MIITAYFLNYIQICHPKPKPPRANTSPPCGRPAKHSPQKIIAGIHAIAPPTECLPDEYLLASSNNPAILEQLNCPLCLRILHQPLELPCRALVCTACMVEWFKVFNCSGVKCPCCFMDTPLTAAQLKAAPLFIQTLLMDIALECQKCRKDIKACEYSTHQCNGEPTEADLQTASHVLRRLVSTHSQPIIIQTGGTVKQIYDIILICTSLAPHIYAYHPGPHSYQDSKCQNH